MKALNLPQIVLLDGGMGRELRARGVEIPDTIWSANGLLVAPETVRQIHIDFISAGCDIITTNTYGLIRDSFAKEGIENRYVELNKLACTLASEAREAVDRSVLIAGSLPPLRGSYRPDLVGKFEDIQPLYREQAEILASDVDLFICETMSSGAEGKAAAHAACQTGKPVWVAWTLHENRSGRLRSGETLSEARAALGDLPVSAGLANCCAPESITSAISELAGLGFQHSGGYANTFQPVPQDWKIDGDKQTDGALDLRQDLDPDSYAAHAADWLKKGATIVGGCCGTRPAHIARLRRLLDEVST